jgi:putative tricarboxylic transport membrane protein
MKYDPVDLSLGLGAVLVAGVYLAMATQIQASLLADEVGPTGLPNAVGWSLVAIGALLAVRSLRFGSAADAGPPGDGAADGSPNADAGGMRPHWLALGLCGIVSVFIVMSPFLGYIASTSLLLGAIALFSGAPKRRMVVVIAVLGAVGLWLLFDKTLGIPLPVGSLWEGS